MKKILISTSILFSVLVVMSLAISPVLASGSASLALSPASGSWQIGQTFKVNIFANGNGSTYDTVRAKISYPSSQLEITNFSLNPVFSFSSGGNGYDNAAGTFSWGAGIAGGTSAPNTFGTITFKVKAAGDAKISFAPDSLVLSAGVNEYDGKINTADFSLAAPLAPVKTQPVSPAKPAPAPKVAPAAPPAQPAENADLGATASGPAINVIDDLAQQGQQTAGVKKFSTAGLIILIIAIILAIALIGGIIYKVRNRNKIMNLPM